MNRMVTAADQAGSTPVGDGLADEIPSRFNTRPIVRIQLLGAMRATSYLGDNVLPRGKRARAVLGYLCLAAGEPVTRSRMAALLWDRVSEDAARTNLRDALREIASAFGMLADELIVIDRSSVRLNVDACWIDALAIRTLDPSALDLAAGDLDVFCRGDLLENLDRASASFARWLLEERVRLAERLELLLRNELERVPLKTAPHGRRLKRSLADMRERLRMLNVRRDSQQSGLKIHDQARFDVEDETDNSVVEVILHPKRSSEVVRDRLRVGVLPFAGGMEKQQSLGLSLSQEIAAALSRFRWFDVIAPISLAPASSTLFVDEHQLRRIADYVVDGIVSSVGIRAGVQINVRLLDIAEGARVVWAERFELPRGELHRLNELVTSRIVARIDPVILFIEGQPKRRDHYGATGLLLLAIPLIFSMERKKYEAAKVLIDRALELDPNNAMVAAWAAHWYVFYGGQRWTKDVDWTFVTAKKYALRAIKLDPDNAEALAIYAHICSYVDKDFDTALRCFDRSLRLNPSLAFTWAFSALTYSYIGKPETALQRLDRYRELAPFDPYYFWFQHFYAIAYTFKGDYEQAVTVGYRSAKMNPDFVAGYKPLIASLGHLGRQEEAKPYIAKLLSLEPNFTVESFGKVYPFKKAGDRRRYMRGLLLAGVPER